MTTEEKRKALNVFCDQHSMCDECPLRIPELRCGRGQAFDLPGPGRVSDKDVDLAYSIAFPDTEEPHIKDSGERREFDTGAVRDIQEGKGRCDLMPLDVVDIVLNDDIMSCLECFQRKSDICYLGAALLHFANKYCNGSVPTMLLEVSKHFEEGAKKYGEHNWEKGIPTHCYIDSAVRHYLKWLRGDTDEPHDRAFVWNILCCIWTCMHKPELNDYGHKDQVESR